MKGRKFFTRIFSFCVFFHTELVPFDKEKISTIAPVLFTSFHPSTGEKLTVVLDYYEALETYSGIGLLRSYANLESYWTTTKLCKLTVVLDFYEAMQT